MSDYEDRYLDAEYEAHEDKFRLSDYPLKVKHEPDSDVEKKVVCDCCRGEGVREIGVEARFSTSYGNYLPHEIYGECGECEGTGFVWTDNWDGKELWDVNEKT